MDDYGLTTVDLHSVGYKDDQKVLASHIAHVCYFDMSENDKQHLVVSGKHRVVRSDGVQSPEEYNNYDELGLFTHHLQKIKAIESRFHRTKMIPLACKDGEGKIMGAPAAK